MIQVNIGYVGSTLKSDVTLCNIPNVLVDVITSWLAVISQFTPLNEFHSQRMERQFTLMMCECVCVCVFVRKRECEWLSECVCVRVRDRESECVFARVCEWGRDREREIEILSECVCVRVRVNELGPWLMKDIHHVRQRSLAQNI